MFGDSRSASAGAEARAWLDVTYADKDAAKALGAPGGTGWPRWFAPAGRVEQLKAWAAAPALPDPLPRGRPDVRCRAVRGPDPAVVLVHQRAHLCVTGGLGAGDGARGGAPAIAARCAVPGPNRRTGCGCRRTNAGPTTTRPGCRPCGGWCACAAAATARRTSGSPRSPDTARRRTSICGRSSGASPTPTSPHCRPDVARSVVDRALDLSILTVAGVLPSPAPTAAARCAIAAGTLDRTIYHTP